MRAAVEAAKTAVAEGLAPLIETAQRELEEAFFRSRGSASCGAGSC
jgi:hypothetical protein